MAFKDLADFASDFVAPGAAPYSVVIEGQHGVIALVEAWNEADHWILSSTEQNGVFFSAPHSVVKDFLVGKKYFLQSVSKK